MLRGATTQELWPSFHPLVRYSKSKPKEKGTYWLGEREAISHACVPSANKRQFSI